VLLYSNSLRSDSVIHTYGTELRQAVYYLLHCTLTVLYYCVFIYAITQPFKIYVASSSTVEPPVFRTLVRAAAICYFSQ
jgi:hypothetical protein